MKRKRISGSSNDDLKKLRESLRNHLKNSKDLIGVLRAYFVEEDGSHILFKCPTGKDKHSIFDTSQQAFFCECGCVGKGDVFALVMHVEGLTFPATIAKLSRDTIITTAKQLRKKRKRGRKPNFRELFQ